MARPQGAARADERNDGYRLDLMSIAGTSGGAESLDRLIHERMRLGIVSALAVAEAMSFSGIL